MPRFISLLVALIATVALFSSGGYVLGRWYEMDGLATVSMFCLKYSLYAVAFCCAYALAVGIYHTILSVTGLDEEREEPAADS
ncbi:MAG: hypothetical protein RMA76_33165 [Deltaproteobacteria bacterium]